MAINDLGTSRRTFDEMGQVVEEMVTAAKSTRRGFERRWYDNNFFDDGYHFRYLSRQTNKIVDLSERANLYYPMRAIPKASRQIRGVTNLLMSNQFVPVVYPKRVIQQNYTSPEEYQAAQKLSKDTALRTGHWLQDEWKRQDLLDKLTLMCLLSMKHSVAFLKIWPDPDKEGINTSVRDAFDIYTLGYMNELYDSPFIIETQTRLLTDIRSDPMFPEERRAKLTADNRQAASDIKDAYQRARFGMRTGTEAAVTLVQKEAFIKERLNKDNKARIRMQEDGEKILAAKDDGDYVLRQTFTAANTTLKDGYVNLKEYPFVDFRMEPGPLYKTSLVERFIPQNKSLDMVVSRVERYTNTMVTGAWIKRQGEQIEFNNQAGGQVLEYAQTPPVQANIAPLPAFIFNFISYLGSLIDEQGVSLSTLGKLPAGVKGYQAIESLKETEYSTLVVASARLRQTIQRVSKRMLELADEYFIKPKEIQFLEKGEPNYFDIIGATALKGYKQLGLEAPESAIPIYGDCGVDIQVESGLGYTKEGQKASARELGDYMIQLAQAGYLPQEAVKIFIEKLMETYQFGSLREFMAAMDASEVIGGLSPKQIDAMKTAVIEVFQDLIKNGILPDKEARIKEIKEVLPDQNTRIMETKVGAAEALKETGVLDKSKETTGDKGPSKSISFKDLPPSGKTQLAAQAGIDIDEGEVRAREAEQAQMEKTKLSIQAQKGGKQNALNKNR